MATRDTTSQLDKPKKKWSLQRAFLCGLAVQSIAFIISVLGDGGENAMHWLQHGRIGEQVGYFGGQLLAAPLIFVFVAFVRNRFVK